MRSLVLSAVIGLAGLISASAQAQEVSLLQGLFRTSAVENGLKSTTINFGGRYGLANDGSGFWFGQLSYSQTSYSGVDPAPSTDSTLRVGGGRRYTFQPFGNRVIPYLSGIVELVQGEDIATKTSGIFYGGQAGLRLMISQKFFVDLESSLFESRLSSTDEDKGSGVKTKRTELAFDTLGAFSNSVVSVGMRL